MFLFNVFKYNFSSTNSHTFSTPTMAITDSIPGAIQATISFLSLLFLSSGFLLYRYQGKLIYPSNFPPGSRTEIPTPDRFGLNEWEEVALDSKDGTKLMAFFVKRVVENGSKKSGKTMGSEDEKGDKEEETGKEEQAKSTLRNRFNPSTSSTSGTTKQSSNQKPISKTTLFYFHANAGNLGHRLPIAKVLQEILPCNVFLLSYRGYGRSEGEPSEHGIRMDAEAGLEYLLNREDIKGSKIILYGQSIGGAVAIDIASRFEEFVDALILENTFLSLVRMVISFYTAFFEVVCS
jgi:abhydrolase domain-containing protein 13